MSGKSIHSPLWHRVERLKPRLRLDVQIERHVIRCDVWYVVRDRFSSRAHRFSPAVYFLLLQMDGTHSFDQIWRQAVEKFGEDAPSQDQILQTASQLYVANMLQSDALVDEGDLADRAQLERDRVLSANLRNPMFVRVPLFDPNRFLDATVHLVRPLCGGLGGIAWLGAMIWFAIQLVTNWNELISDVSDKVLAGQSVATVLLVYPILKALHEFGHAFATKLAGQEVHEMGVMFLTLLPAPYIDASASALIPNKWKRVSIAAAGMMVELAVAAAAMLVWLEAQPGLVRSLAYDTIFVASVSTLLFNGNPLLRFDAYYILSDALEMPNLASRAQQYYLYLAQRYLFGASDARDPVTAKGERFWFLLYAPASFAYRMLTLSGIALFLSTKYFFIGVALAVWMVASSIVWPAMKAMKFVFLSPAIAGVRWRAAGVTVLALGAIAAAVAVLPIPNGTVARGLVWIPDESRVVAQSSGRFVRWLVEPGTTVGPGEALAVLEEPLNSAKRKDAKARLAEIEAHLRSAQAHSPYDAQVLNRQRDLAIAELADFERQEADLTVRSPCGGMLIVPHSADLPDNFVKRGQTIGFVMASRSPRIRASVPESEIEYVRDRTLSVSLRFDEAPWSPIHSATVLRQTPKSTHILSSPALSVANGGPFTPDPQSKDKEKGAILESVFEIEVGVPDQLKVDRWGQRVWVRFDHGSAPAIERIYRSLRQLFLGRFHV